MSPTSAVAGTRNLMGNSSSKATESIPECGRRCAPSRPSVGVSEHLPLVPAIALALLPKCPLCLAPWFGILGSLGATSWLSTVWGTPLAVGLLSFAVGALVMGAWRSRDARPLWVGLLGAAALLCGKCLLNVPLLLYAGLGMLIGASFWSSWLKSPWARVSITKQPRPYRVWQAKLPGRF